jgi:HD-GYP domain-containing protein (c-di-GMP phosphodiesterase class II)
MEIPAFISISSAVSVVFLNPVGAVLKLPLFYLQISSEWISILAHALAFSYSQSIPELLCLCTVLYMMKKETILSDRLTKAFLTYSIILFSVGLFSASIQTAVPPLACLFLSLLYSSQQSRIADLDTYMSRVLEEKQFFLSKLEALQKTPSSKESPIKRSSSLLNKLRTIRSNSLARFFTEGSDNESVRSGYSQEVSSRKSSFNVEESSEGGPNSASSGVENVLPGISNEEVKEIINTLITQEYLIWNPQKCGEDEIDVIAVALEAKKVFTQSIENLPGSSHRTMKVQRIKRVKSIVSTLELSEPLTDVLESIGEWDFNCFELIKITKVPAFEVGLYIFNTLGLNERFSIDNTVLRKFLTVVEHGYIQNNYYHNSIHAADVAASTLFLIQKGLSRCGNLVDLDVFALIVAALCHDIGHPGVNNAFLVATSNELALKYNDSSCLENMHANKAFTILKADGCRITQYLNKADYQRFRKTAISAILSTDLQVHFDKLNEFRINLDKKLDISDDKFRTLAIQMCLKCADIGHGARKLNIHMNWTSLITKEFFKQGEKEKECGVPLSPLCDRDNCVVSKSQIGFLEVLVRPLFKVWEEFIEQNNEEESELEVKICMNNIAENIEYWSEEHQRVLSGQPTFFLDNDPPPLLSNA